MENFVETLTHPSNYGGAVRGRHFIIMHGTGKSPATPAENEIKYLQRQGVGVSYHYYITKTGRVHQMVPDYQRAWHAGSSRFTTADGKSYQDLNDWSIGVALESSNGVREVYPSLQVSAASRLVERLMEMYSVPAENVVTHREVSFPVGRKIDPVNFDIDKFRDLVGGPKVTEMPAYHPVTNEFLGNVTVVEGRKVYPQWLKSI